MPPELSRDSAPATHESDATDTTNPADALLRAAHRELADARTRSGAVGNFSRRLAHDLSNFLTVVRTYSELLLADAPLEHPSRGDLQEIAEAAETTIAYIQRVSAAGRAGVARTAPVALDVFVRDGLSAGLLAAMQPLTVELASDATVAAAPAAMNEAIGELLRNAREASADGATISLRTRKLTLAAPQLLNAVPLAAGEWALVEIRDHGAGFDRCEGSPMEPFVTTKSGVRGAGMGLSIARAAAWAAEGQLTLVRDGSETVACLWIPLSSERDGEHVGEHAGEHAGEHRGAHTTTN